MPNNRTISARAPVLPLLIGAILGLCAASRSPAPVPLLLAGALIACIATLFAASRNRPQQAWAPCFLIAATLAFWAYGQIRLPQLPDPFDLALPEREARIILDIQRMMQPAADFENSNGIARVARASQTSRLNKGDYIYFRLKRAAIDSTQIQRGIRIQTTGVLYPIATKSDQSAQDENNFDAYLKDIGVHYRFERTGDTQLIRPPSHFNTFCATMNERFQGYLRLGEATDTELANVYIAMLLGRKVELTDQQNERYRMSGTMHFFAISGLHIGVIATVIAQFLFLLRVPRSISPWIGLPLLYLYVEITGASPSAVRAFLMAAFFWASYSCKRQRSPFAALMASAVLVLLIQPEQLHSVGFQLSYTVVLSILLFGLPFYEVLAQNFQPYHWLPKADWSRYQQAIAWSVDKAQLLFAISFSAWIISTPLSAGLFGFIAPGALPLNMLLVNLATLVISGGVIALACATVWLPAMAGFVNHSAWIVISIMDAMVKISIQVPGALLPTQAFPLGFSYFALAAFFAALFWIHHDQRKLNSRYILLPPLIILCVMVSGLIAMP
jgi:competence protein ComEC